MKSKHTIGRILGAASLLAFLAGLWMVFSYAPREAEMGEIQRIFYYHVASAWVGFFGFFVTFACGVAYLATGKRKWDTIGLSSAEVGLVFITMTLITGSLWARPVWGVYWVWEPRLTISAVQWLLYVAYAMLRASVLGEERSARLASVYSIAAFVTVPLSWFAIRWWRTIHPQVLYGTRMALAPQMLHTLFFSLGVFTLLYLALMWQRVRLEMTRQAVAEMRMLAELDRSAELAGAADLRSD